MESKWVVDEIAVVFSVLWAWVNEATKSVSAFPTIGTINEYVPADFVYVKGGGTLL